LVLACRPFWEGANGWQLNLEIYRTETQNWKRRLEMKSNKKGGGIGSREVREVGNRTGAPRREVNVRALSQVGQALGNKSTEKSKVLNPVENFYTGRGYPSTLGNAKALDVGKGGVGTGRNLYGKSGSQTQYGPPAGQVRPQGADILNDFGPDSSIVKTRK
jgi:hypothetical protein